MSKEGLTKLFNPKNIAVIGASRRPEAVGHGILKSLLEGGVLKSDYITPFKGKIYPINPNAENILGIKSYKSVKDINSSIDLAIIAVPSKIVPFIIEECGGKKIPFAIIISAGFQEIGNEGKKIQNKVIEIAKKNNIRIVGPNCLGIISPANSMNASFGVSMPPKGDIAFISQSGAIADSIIDWSIGEKYGFSHILSYGNAADLEVCDFLNFLKDDKNTKAIAIYMEGIRDGKKFMETAKKITKKKPIIVLKAGKTKSGSKAISSHTGSIAGSHEAYKAAFKQSGVIMADTVEELFDYAKTVAQMPPCENNGTVIITNAGGVGVLCSDYCEEFDVKLSNITESALKKLDRSGKMHPAYSRRNPLDLVGDALPQRYEVAVNTILAEKNVHSIIVVQTLQTMTKPLEDAKVVINANKKYPKKPILCTYMGGFYSKEGIKLLENNKIPDFNDPQKAVKALKVLTKRYEWLKEK